MLASTKRFLSKPSAVVRTFNLQVTIKQYTFRHNSNIVQSPLPAVDIPNVTIPEYIFSDFSKFPQKTAVECGLTGRKYTFEEVRKKSKNFNKALRKKICLKKGDVVAVLLPNVPEYPICVLGALEAALTVTTISPLYGPEEIKRQLLDANAKVIITIGSLGPIAQNGVKLAQRQIPIITIKTQVSEPTPLGFIDFQELSNTELDVEDVPPGDVNDIAIMPYSSGTTGIPKGVQHTHHTLIANVCQINAPDVRLTQNTTGDHQDEIPAVLPFFHIYGLVVLMLNHLHNKSKLVTLPQFTPELFVNTLAKYKSEVLYIVPPMVLFLANHPSVKKEYFQSVRSICSGAAPLGAMDEERLIKKIEKDISLVQGYGLTETSVFSINTAQLKKKHGSSASVGIVLPNSAAKLVPVDNIKGETLDRNQPGELLIKGPQVMKGYHNKLKETEETFVDGWMRTGDLVYYDENGLIYVTDRLKELIKVKSYQVAPAELEEIVRSYPDIADAAVIGIPHKEYGEVPRAYVTARPNVKVNTKKLEEYVAHKVANYKQLKGGVAIVDSIPKTASGKILRKELKLLYENENKNKP